MNTSRLPDWAQRAIEPNGVMENISRFDLKMYADNTKLARLHSGFILKDILNQFSQKINSTLKPDRSLYFQSTHYYIIANLLNSLGMFEVIEIANRLDKIANFFSFLATACTSIRIEFNFRTI